MKGGYKFGVEVRGGMIRSNGRGREAVHAVGHDVVVEDSVLLYALALIGAAEAFKRGLFERGYTFAGGGGGGGREKAEVGRVAFCR